MLAHNITVLWIFVAIIFVFPMVTNAVVLFTTKWTNAGRKLLEACIPPVLVDIDGDGTADFGLPEKHAAWFFVKNFMPATSVWLALQLISAAAFCATEGWNFGDAFYHCVVTATTVGYGDLKIDHPQGKVVACVHIIFSVAMLGAPRLGLTQTHALVGVPVTPSPTRAA